jgi:Aspartyl/Asparaginyl beta-hydroxylase
LFYDTHVQLPTARTALFSRLGAGTRISSHRGWAELANHVLRCHLSLVVPTTTAATAGTAAGDTTATATSATGTAAAAAGGTADTAATDTTDTAAAGSAAAGSAAVTTAAIAATTDTATAAAAASNTVDAASSSSTDDNSTADSGSDDGCCGLWVEGQRAIHRAGEIVVFDDSKLHKVRLHVQRLLSNCFLRTAVSQNSAVS